MLYIGRVAATSSKVIGIENNISHIQTEYYVTEKCRIIEPVLEFMAEFSLKYELLHMLSED